MAASAFALLGLLSSGWALPVIPEDFLHDLRCPFAKVWLEHGPEKAGELLGITPHAMPNPERGLQADNTWGTCSYRIEFPPPGRVLCIEFRGSDWNQSSASGRCEGLSGTLEVNTKCDLEMEDLAGWCATKNATEVMPMHMSASSTCTSVAGDCRTWSQGAFWPDGQCKDMETVTALAAGPARCTIANGAAGAAHQLAQSPGYAVDCEGTPAQGSPFMWPLRWTAMVKQESMEFGSDEVKFESLGRVYYMLDRNWKRGDTFFRRGIQRSAGQGPCSTPVNGTSNACNRTGLQNTTFLHRNDKMVFIDWAEDGTIQSCSWLDMRIVGNIRPDWFLDNRGDSTDVQYLGDSHVYYRGKPRLVKQWRKKDFASQYFTMSMQRLAGPDGVNWPLILNVPGEGLGDDFLQHWYDHRVLNESETAFFLLDEEYVRNGGSCPERVRPSGGGGGRPEPVPSSLEVDPAAWVTRVYTGSPVWTPPANVSDDDSVGFFTQRVAEGIDVTSCFDVASSTLQLNITFALGSPVWAAVGFREDSECLMTPRGGGDGEILFAHPSSEDDSYSVGFGPMSPSMKQYQDHAVAAFMGRLRPVNEVDAIDRGSAEFDNGNVSLQFSRKYDMRPNVFNLTYAYGREKRLGYHASRGCFTVKAMLCPVCNVEEPTTTTRTRTMPRSSPVSAFFPSTGMGEATIAGSQHFTIPSVTWTLALALVATRCL